LNQFLFCFLVEDQQSHRGSMLISEKKTKSNRSTCNEKQEIELDTHTNWYIRICTRIYRLSVEMFQNHRMLSFERW